MHEVSLVMGLFEILEEQAIAHQFETIQTIHLEVGKLSCVEPKTLHFCFETAKPGTIADGATLQIHEVSARARCPACEQLVTLDSYLDPCPSCGEYGLQVESGTDLTIKELEVD